MLDTFITSTKNAAAAAAGGAPPPSRRAQLQRSLSDSQSLSIHSKYTRGTKDSDLNSFFFHQNPKYAGGGGGPGGGIDDNATFQSRFSDYQFSEATRSTRHSVALAGLSIIASQIDDTLSLYTSNTGPPDTSNDTDALERAIQEGQKRALLEAQDEVMGLEEHQAYRASLQHTIREQNRRLSAEGRANGGVLLSSSHRRLSVPLNLEVTAAPPEQPQQLDASNGSLQLSELQERKEHRKHSRQVHAEKKHHQHHHNHNSGQSCKRDTSTSPTEEMSQTDTLESLTTLGLEQSQASLGKLPTSKRSTTSSSKRSTGSTSRSSNRNHNKDGGGEKQRRPHLMHRGMSQPSLMSNGTQVCGVCAWDGDDDNDEENKRHQEIQRIPPRGKTRPPVTKKTRAIVVNQDEVDEGRSRSLTRAVGNVVRRSLSRTMKKMRGEKTTTEQEGDNKDRDDKDIKSSSKSSSSKKKICTCPSEDVMLMSCPKHGEKARRILEKKAKSDERKEKQQQLRSKSAKLVRKRSPSSGGRPRRDQKENRRNSMSKKDTTVCVPVGGGGGSSSKASSSNNHKRRERGRSKLVSSTHTEATAPLSSRSFSRSATMDSFGESNHHNEIMI